MKVKDYRIIKGLPSDVGPAVREMIAQGWDLNSQMLPMKVDNYDIVIQCMVLYEKEEMVSD